MIWLLRLWIRDKHISTNMNQELSLRIILKQAPAGVDYGLQKGSGHLYETIQKQRGDGGDLLFEFGVNVKFNADDLPNFLGVFVHGPANERFVYLDIGTAAGQFDSVWSRRLKVPLRNITTEMVKSLLADAHLILETSVMGMAKDNTPTCGTVKPFDGWYLSKK